MAVPAGYVALDLVGFTDKGAYAAATTYMQNDLVHQSNSVWRCKTDNTKGVAPAENANWTVFINSATNLAGITGVDASGVLGTAGASVASQALINAIADKVMTKLIEKTKIVNNLLATDTSTVLSGPMGKELDSKISTLNGEMSTAKTNIADLDTEVAKKVNKTDLYKNASTRMATGSVMSGGNFHEIKLQVEVYSSVTVLAVYDNTDSKLIGNITIPK